MVAADACSPSSLRAVRRRSWGGGEGRLATMASLKECNK